jgi:hypothetical protein
LPRHGSLPRLGLFTPSPSGGRHGAGTLRRPRLSGRVARCSPAGRVTERVACQRKACLHVAAVNRTSKIHRVAPARVSAAVERSSSRQLLHDLVNAHRASDHRDDGCPGGSDIPLSTRHAAFRGGSERVMPCHRVRQLDAEAPARAARPVCPPISFRLRASRCPLEGVTDRRDGRHVSGDDAERFSERRNECGRALPGQRAPTEVRGPGALPGPGHGTSVEGSPYRLRSVGVGPNRPGDGRSG